jgi:hypothetical protein
MRGGLLQLIQSDPCHWVFLLFIRIALAIGSIFPPFCRVDAAQIFILFSRLFLPFSCRREAMPNFLNWWTYS